MNTSISRSTFALLAAAIILLTCSQANAQSDFIEYWFHGGTYETQAQREALYASNAQRPLGGLFAPGFTRTLTFLGGVNFPSASITDDLFELELTDTEPFDDREVDDSGYALSFAFGRRHSRTLRSEIEVAFRSNNINSIGETNITPEDPNVPGFTIFSEDEDGSVDVTSVMKNFIYEFDNNSRFRPYAGVGIGISYVDVAFGEFSNDAGEATFQDGDETFTYQAIGGVSTRLTASADFIVEYRFLGTSDVNFAGFDQPFNYNTSSLLFGLKFEY